jgi:hypothetical protein
MAVIPLPLTEADRRVGYDWELSMNQVELSRTLVLDRPSRGRAFFEHVITDNLSLGRPDNVEVLFGRKILSHTPGHFHTQVVTRGVDARLSIAYKRSWVKEYLKEGRAIRIETVINNPTDIGIKRRLRHLGALGAACRKVNRRILYVQRVASAPSLSTSLFERVALPDGRAGERTVALRYGDQRAMALMAALALCLHHVSGFTHKSLLPVVATLLGKPYSKTQMSYDLWRLRTNGHPQAPRDPLLRPHSGRQQGGVVLHEDLRATHRPALRSSRPVHQPHSPTTTHGLADDRQDNRPAHAGRADSRVNLWRNSSPRAPEVP